MASTFAIILLNLIVAEIFGIGLCILLFYYVFAHLKDGIGWDGYSQTRNLHILLMPLGLVFFTGNSLVIYRIFRNTKTLRLKFIHSLIHTICIATSAFGLSSIIDSKTEPIDANNKAKYPDFASLHSWTGTIALIILLLEYASGIITYCMDCLPWEIEDNYAYLHSFFGISNFVLNSLVSVLGLVTMSSSSYTYTRHRLACTDPMENVPYIENFIGVFILLFTGYLLHILLNPYFKWDREIRFSVMATTFAIILLNLIVAEIFGIGLCILIIYYVFGHLEDGVGWGEEYEENRNLHILLMPIGLVFFTGNSLVLYRFFRKTKTLRLKFIHSLIHTICIVTSSIGLSAIVDSKSSILDPYWFADYKDFATLHAWVGACALILLLLEYISGIMMYCMDCLPWEIEDNYAYLHAFFGICNFVLNGLVAILGLLTMSVKNYTYTRNKLGCTIEEEKIKYVENFIAVFILLFTGYLLHILLNPYFKWEREIRFSIMATVFAIILLNIIVAEIFGVVLCILLFYYVFDYLEDGVWWGDDQKENRNLHILLMPIGLVFLTGNSLVIYRCFRKTKTLRLKFVHSLIHTICIVTSSIGLSAIVDSKGSQLDDYYDADFKSFRTLHSWLGAFALIMLLLEYISGIMMYCMDCLPWEIEDNYAYLHAFFGICNFVLNGLVSVLGLLTMCSQDYTFTRNKLDCEDENEEVPYMENFIGVFILLFTGYLLHILLNPYFRWERVF